MKEEKGYTEVLPGMTEEELDQLIRELGVEFDVDDEGITLVPLEEG